MQCNNVCVAVEGMLKGIKASPSIMLSVKTHSLCAYFHTSATSWLSPLINDTKR